MTSSLPAPPLVSVVMCIYNGERFLKDQIDSILQQTYTNIELVCVDDQSTDRSVAIIQEYQRQDSRVKLFENERNLGFNKNFERGFSLCTGEFIAISDQDDVWHSHKIEDLIFYIGNSLLVYSNSELIDEDGKKLHQNLESSIKHVHDPSYKGFLEYNFVTGHTCLFKRELLQYITPIPKNVLYYDWWIGFTAAYVGKVFYLDKILTQYRLHSNSVIQKLKSSHTDKETEKGKRYAQALSFAEADFVKPKDKKEILNFLRIKLNASKDLFSSTNCYVHLLKNHRQYYPWYKKSFISKLNFIRRQCK